MFLQSIFMIIFFTKRTLTSKKTHQVATPFPSISSSTVGYFLSLSILGIEHFLLQLTCWFKMQNWPAFSKACATASSEAECADGSTWESPTSGSSVNSLASTWAADPTKQVRKEKKQWHKLFPNMMLHTWKVLLPLLLYHSQEAMGQVSSSWFQAKLCILSQWTINRKSRNQKLTKRQYFVLAHLLSIKREWEFIGVIFGNLTLIGCNLSKRKRGERRKKMTPINGFIS